MTPAEPDVLHRRIRQDIEGRIMSGEWPPGHRIPSEMELTATYGCSRMTVNKVVSRLATAGLVQRRRRAGTFVSRPQVQSAILAIPDIRATVEARGERYGYALLSSRVRGANPADRTLLPVEPNSPVRLVRCRHDAAGRPFAFEERRLNLQAVPSAAEADFADVPPGAWLLEHAAWTEAEHRVRAETAERSGATALGVPPGTPCLVVERRTRRSGVPITHVRQVFLGEAFELTGQFGPAGP